MTIDHVLMLGFGGPTAPSEIRPFLEEVTRGQRIPPQRLDAVAHHYDAVGGSSPYNACATRLAERVREQLQASGLPLPLFLAMRNWHPFFRDVLTEIHGRGLRHGLALILAPHRSQSSFEKYVERLQEAQQAAGATAIRYDFAGPWFAHPRFIEAQAARVEEALAGLDPAFRRDAHVVFCAHSIPIDMPGREGYEREFRRSSELTAERLNIEPSRWSLAYQSRSGPPAQPWLTPDVTEHLKQLAGQGVHRVVLAPIGFLFDHVEVLYDLDIEAAQTAADLGLTARRASTVMDHPAFVSMWIDIIGSPA